MESMVERWFSKWLRRARGNGTGSLAGEKTEGGDSLVVCAECGEPLTRSSTQRKRFCDQRCYQRHVRAKNKSRKWGIVKCKECKREFVQKREDHRICSDTCRRSAHHKYLKEVAKRRRKIVPKQIPCSQCGQLFTPPYPRSKICSEACKRLRKHRVPKLLPLPIENVRDVNETDIANSEYAKELQEYKAAGGKVTTYTAEIAGHVPNVGLQFKFREADPNTLNAKDLANLVDEPEDIFNNENY